MSLDRFGGYTPDLAHPAVPSASTGGVGSPEGVVTAYKQYQTYWRSDNNTLYVFEGTVGTNTGWAAHATGVGGSGETYAGSGSPEGAQAGNPGATYLDVTNHVLYLKETGAGNTGWAEYVA